MWTEWRNTHHGCQFEQKSEKKESIFSQFNGQKTNRTKVKNTFSHFVPDSIWFNDYTAIIFFYKNQFLLTHPNLLLPSEFIKTSGMLKILPKTIINYAKEIKFLIQIWGSEIPLINVSCHLFLERCNNVKLDDILYFSVTARSGQKWRHVVPVFFIITRLRTQEPQMPDVNILRLKYACVRCGFREITVRGIDRK